MKIAAMIMIAGLAGTLAQARKTETPARTTVTVCMNATGDPYVPRAKTIASIIFARAGVVLNWRNQRSCPSEAIRISLGAPIPPDSSPTALAVALPYEGVHIQVFYSRVLGMFAEQRAPFILAHVLVHEITHILQGFIGHSKRGIMRANWDENDYMLMDQKAMALTQEDVELIYLGIAGRSRRGAAIASSN